MLSQRSDRRDGMRCLNEQLEYGRIKYEEYAVAVAALPRDVVNGEVAAREQSAVRIWEGIWNSANNVA